MMPNSCNKNVNSSALMSGSMSASARFTPLGLPVVPDV
jgi:hypothetical protein